MKKYNENDVLSFTVIFQLITGILERVKRFKKVFCIRKEDKFLNLNRNPKSLT